MGDECIKIHCNYTGVETKEVFLVVPMPWKVPKVLFGSVTKPGKNEHLNLMELSLLPNSTLLSVKGTRGGNTGYSGSGIILSLHWGH